MRVIWLVILPTVLTGCICPAVSDTTPVSFKTRTNTLVDLTGVQRNQQLAADEAFRITPLVEDENQSALLVQIRTSLPPHFHQRTHEVLYLLEGEGVLQLDQERIPIRRGAVVRIQPAQVHTFMNGGADPAIFLVVTSPRFDEGDRIMADAPP